MTTVNPASTARREASDALITEVHPLIPHAHGILSSSSSEQRRKPVGKGIPIKNAGNAITMIEMRSFINME